MRFASAFRTSAAGPAVRERARRVPGLRRVPLKGLMSRVLSADEIHELLAPLGGYARVALAVSGGGDSTALMLLAQEWAARAPGAPALRVLTVDHGLRPNSRRDGEWVAARAAGLGLECHILRWCDPPPDASQAEARVARYNLLTGFARDRGIGAVVTAHTRDDVAETFLMRLARGSGLAGLAAIEPESAWNGVPVLRPLLGVSRAQLRAELQVRGGGWLEDPSNAEPRFERVRVRAALPTLAALGITPARIAHSAHRLRRARHAIGDAAAEFLADHVEADPGGYLRVNAGALDGVPEEIAIDAFAQMLCAVAGRQRKPRLRKLEMLTRHLRHVSRVGMTLGGCVLLRAALCEALLICREPGRLRAAPVTLAPGDTVIWDGRFRVRAGALQCGSVCVDALGEANSRALPEQVRRAHPRPALASLPAIYSQDGLLGIPLPGYAPAGQHSDAAACQAEFLWPPVRLW